MDEGRKPFPIEFIVILTIVAAANDIAEIVFDLLDLTGVGLAGEGIMVPIDLVMDLFFTAIFLWRVGPGGGTITQYIDDLLEPLLIPGRTISVVIGMWIANNPNSAVGKAGNLAASLEGGNVEGLEGEAEGAARGAGGAAATEREAEIEAESVAQNNAQKEGGAKSAEEGEGGGSSTENTRKKGSADEESNESPSREGQNEAAPANDIFENPYDNPVGTAGEELNQPSETEFKEGRGFEKNSTEEAQENTSPKKVKKVVDISSRTRHTAPPKIEDRDEDLRQAA